MRQAAKCQHQRRSCRLRQLRGAVTRNGKVESHVWEAKAVSAVSESRRHLEVPRTHCTRTPTSGARRAVAVEWQCLHRVLQQLLPGLPLHSRRRRRRVPARRLSEWARARVRVRVRVRRGLGKTVRVVRVRGSGRSSCRVAASTAKRRVKRQSRGQAQARGVQAQAQAQALRRTVRRSPATPTPGKGKGSSQAAASTKPRQQQLTVHSDGPERRLFLLHPPPNAFPRSPSCRTGSSASWKGVSSAGSTNGCTHNPVTSR